MTMSRGLMRVLLASVAWTGVLVTYGATKTALNASAPIPECNCNTWEDCNPSGGWKCVSESNLCKAVAEGDCGPQVTCKAYCFPDT